jgi:hypothetical protein
MDITVYSLIKICIRESPVEQSIDMGLVTLQQLETEPKETIK